MGVDLIFTCGGQRVKIPHTFKVTQTHWTQDKTVGWYYNGWSWGVMNQSLCTSPTTHLLDSMKSVNNKDHKITFWDSYEDYKITVWDSYDDHKITVWDSYEDHKITVWDSYTLAPELSKFNKPNYDV
jgi:hypothetical protein